jgi:ubiquinone/menaquinone biosynthesis C-methylase UbiE
MQKNSLQIVSKIKEIYENNGNIIKYLKNEKNTTQNSIEDILISYDFQSGTYIDFVTQNPEYINKYTESLAKVIKNLGNSNLILEVGVGECTTLTNLIQKLNKNDCSYLGFDISWSRVHLGLKYLKTMNKEAKVFVGDLFNIPLATSSIDIVYTSHSIEPNGGREKEALQELFRITKNYLVLLEPTNEFATSDGKLRMIDNGYVQNLKSVIEELGYNLIEYRKFEICSNELNPTGLYIIEKHTSSKMLASSNFHCPISMTPLNEYDDHFFSEESLISYPKVGGIPCLCSTYGILTSKHNF